MCPNKIKNIDLELFVFLVNEINLTNCCFYFSIIIRKKWFKAVMN